MPEFTYEKETLTTPLEKYEWDNVWWEHTENKTSPRVLYIGDSISCGTRPMLNKLADGRILFDGFGTSKAPDNPWLISSLKSCLAQMQRLDGIIINHGLHGWHMDAEAYRNSYREELRFLRGATTKPIWVVLSTGIGIPDDREATIIRRNEIAKELAAELGLGIIDFYAVNVKYNELHASDHVHFTEEGYCRLAECVLDTLTPILG